MPRECALQVSIHVFDTAAEKGNSNMKNRIHRSTTTPTSPVVKTIRIYSNILYKKNILKDDFPQLVPVLEQMCFEFDFST